MTDSNHEVFGKEIPLGKQSAYVSVYTPALLYGMPRSVARSGLGLAGETLPFSGADLWNAYELSWLNQSGRPEIAVAQIAVPCTSATLIESKSLKLYLNSFAQTKFQDRHEIITLLVKDLSQIAGAPVLVDLLSMEQVAEAGLGNFSGICLDRMECTTDVYVPDADLLAVESSHVIVQESLYSHLLRSVCPVTGQPDLGSVLIEYTGPLLKHEGLLKYLISFREHHGFHEQCIEKIFVDIQQRCAPTTLSVYGRFLRRGGIDINPWRTNADAVPARLRLLRQ